MLFAADAFAGCIFINGEPAVHRVIKKYVIRAKRGTAQSTHDNKNATKKSSMGAQIRRENEKELLKKITAQITDWRDDLKKCKTIFIRAPRHQKYAILQPLHEFVEDRNIIRPCPCPMHKPRFKEVIRMYSKIFSIKLANPVEESDFTKSPKKENHSSKPEKESEKPEINSEPEMSDEELLEMSEVTESTQNLQIFENTKKPKKRPKNKKPKPKSDTPIENPENSENRYKPILDELFTAVKSSNAMQVDKIIQKVKSTDKPEDLQLILNMALCPNEKVCC